MAVFGQGGGKVGCEARGEMLFHIQRDRRAIIAHGGAAAEQALRGLLVKGRFDNHDVEPYLLLSASNV